MKKKWMIAILVLFAIPVFYFGSGLVVNETPHGGVYVEASLCTYVQQLVLGVDLYREQHNEVPENYAELSQYVFATQRELSLPERYEHLKNIKYERLTPYEFVVSFTGPSGNMYSVASPEDVQNVCRNLDNL